MELFSKVIVKTDSQKVSGNAITGVDHGHIFQMEKGASMEIMNMGNSKLPELSNLIELWKSQYDNSASVYGANTGEAPTAGTPYSQTALLNQVANSPFEYQREVWGIFLNEILNDWIKPFLKKRIMKPHYLVSEYDDDDLVVIDNAIGEFEAKKVLKDNLLKGKTMSAEEYLQAKDAVKTSLRTLGKRREIEIPKGFLDVEGKITANITGELKNKAAMLQSLDSVFGKIISTYNPNTGTFSAFTDKTLRKLIGEITELAGIPFSFAQFPDNAPTQGLNAPNMTTPTPSADLSAVTPATPVAA